MTTNIKIDFDDDGIALHLRINHNGEQTLLPGATCDLSALNSLLSGIKEDVGVVEVVAGVAAALSANKITLVEAERIRERERQLDASLNHKRQQIAELECCLSDQVDAVAIVDKQSVLAALTRDVAEICAIVDKQAKLAELNTQVEAKTAEVVVLDADIKAKTIVEEPAK